MIVSGGTIWLGKRSGETRCGKHTSIADEESNTGVITMNDPAARNLIQGHSGATTPKSTVYMSYWYNGTAPPPPMPAPTPSSSGCITFTYTGHYCYWTPPAGVTSVSVVAVGGGGLCSAGAGGGALSWQNNIPVSSCTRYAIWAGASGDRSQFGVSGVPFNGHNLVLAGGGGNYCYCYCRGGYGGTAYHASQYTAGSSGGGNGGCGGSGIKYVCCRQYVSGGGGAGGYTGPGGNGGSGAGGTAGFSGSGGGGGGGGSGFSGNATGGGGVGIRGLGPSGAGGSLCHGGSGGSGGGSGTILGGNYGGGGFSSGVTQGGFGAVRIVWPGTTRQFPSTNVS